MKNIIFWIDVTLFEIFFNPLQAQVTAIGNVSAEVVESNNIIFNPGSKLSNNTAGSQIILSHSGQSFIIGEFIYNQGGESVYNFTVKPFQITSKKGRKMVITPSFDSPSGRSSDSKKILKLKGKMQSIQKTVDKDYKGFYHIVQNFN